MASSGFQCFPVLMAMSQAANVDGDSSPDSSRPSPQRSPALVVKNTFIELVEGGENVPCEMVQRRTMSAPATPRAANSLQAMLAEMQDTTLRRPEGTRSNDNMTTRAVGHVNQSPPCAELGFKSEAWSTMSETTGAEDFDDLQTDIGAEIGSDSGSDSQQSASGASQSAGIPVSLADALFSAPDAPQEPHVPIALNDLLSAHLAKRPPRTALTSKANAWTPKTLGLSSVFPAEVTVQFAKVLEAGQAVMRSCGFLGRVQMAERAGAWSIEGIAKSVLSTEQVQLLFEAVQRAILHAAGNSDHVYVIGYQKTPFVPKAGCGFSFRLAMVQDEHSACWDHLSVGHCSRGLACRHQHPIWQAAIDVSLTKVFLG